MSQYSSKFQLSSSGVLSISQHLRYDGTLSQIPIRSVSFRCFARLWGFNFQRSNCNSLLQQQFLGQYQLRDPTHKLPLRCSRSQHQLHKLDAGNEKGQRSQHLDQRSWVTRYCRATDSLVSTGRRPYMEH